MTPTAYDEGYCEGMAYGGDAEAIEAAIRECEERGWWLLSCYFRGRLCAVREREAKVAAQEDI